MDYILNKDKIADPQRVCYVLEEEMKSIVENYLHLSKEFKVRFRKEDKKNIFFC